MSTHEHRHEQQPDLDRVESCFVALLEGRISRDAADRWAAYWAGKDVHDDGSPVEWDEPTWWALGLLHGIDLRPGPGEPYLHDDEQLRGWLDALRRRRTE
ncbi:hypothetical protein [Streptomyces sp. NPDC048172]|uniref:hypothetical protein n=1 Tax=Streptomyces sp. NPDC048172 TaxID=3365505 RepID=UPI00371EAB1B